MLDEIYKKIFGKKKANPKDPVVDEIRPMDCDEPVIIEVLPIDSREPKIIRRIPGHKPASSLKDGPYVDKIINLDDVFPSDIPNLTPKEFSKICRNYLKESMYEGKCYKNEDFVNYRAINGAAFHA